MLNRSLLNRIKNETLRKSAAAIFDLADEVVRAAPLLTKKIATLRKERRLKSLARCAPRLNRGSAPIVRQMQQTLRKSRPGNFIRTLKYIRQIGRKACGPCRYARMPTAENRQRLSYLRRRGRMPSAAGWMSRLAVPHTEEKQDLTSNVQCYLSILQTQPGSASSR